MLKRLLVGLLAAGLLLTACAVTLPPEESEESVSERPQEVSIEEISSEAQSSEPEPVLPEEKDTVLELVATFKTGIDGLFQYFFYWAEAGAEHASYWTTRAECADDKGNLYANVYSAWREGDICRLNDGKRYSSGSSNGPLEMLYSNGLLYLRLEDNDVVTIDVESGKRTLISPFVYLQMSPHDFSFVSVDGEEPFWLHWNGMERYSLRGEALPAEEYPCAMIAAEDRSRGKATLFGRGKEWVLSLDGDAAGGDWSLHYEDSEKVLCVAKRFKNDFPDEPYTAVREEVYCLYDQNGNILSKFKYTMVRHDEQPCSLPFTRYEQASTLEWYHPFTVTIGNDTFEEVFDHRVVCGSDGTLYLLLYYLDRGEVYRILPGYENATFSELTGP